MPLVLQAVDTPTHREGSVRSHLFSALKMGRGNLKWTRACLLCTFDLRESLTAVLICRMLLALRLERMSTCCVCHRQNPGIRTPSPTKKTPGRWPPRWLRRPRVCGEAVDAHAAKPQARFCAALGYNQTYFCRSGVTGPPFSGGNEPRNIRCIACVRGEGRV